MFQNVDGEHLYLVMERTLCHFFYLVPTRERGNEVRHILSAFGTLHPAGAADRGNA